MTLQLTKSKSSIKLNEKLSINYIQKVYGISVSSILYIRKIFPENAFEKIKDKSMDLNVLIADEHDPNAYYVYKMMQGCYDAIKKKYLKKVIMGFYIEEDIAKNFIEYYIFQFSSNNKMQVKIKKNKNVDKLTSYKSDNPLNLIQSLEKLKNIFIKLPRNTRVSMRIFYYEDITPLDYQAPGFISTRDFDKLCKLNQLKIGQMTTKWHMLSLNVFTNRNLMQDIEIASTNKNISTFLDYESDLNSPLPLAKDQTCSNYDDVNVYNIQCPCQIKDILEGNMLVCNICRKYQHGACHKNLDISTIQNHTCIKYNKKNFNIRKTPMKKVYEQKVRRPIVLKTSVVAEEVQEELAEMTINEGRTGNAMA
ncbi:unnamed protein product, partial [Gordionus sp. m RMFG-2023]